MSEEIQKIGWDNSRALCEAGAIPREPVLNDGVSDSDGPELIVSDDTGTTFYHFPSLERLAISDTGYSGIALLGVDDGVFTNISGTDGQSILESIDDVLTVALSAGSTATLSDVSVQSLTTAQQTFTLKSSTSLIVEDDTPLNLLNISTNEFTVFAEGDITFGTGSSGDIIMSPSGKILLSADVEIGGNWLYIYGDESTNGSIRTGKYGSDVVWQWREAGTWVTKSTITP